MKTTDRWKSHMLAAVLASSLTSAVLTAAPALNNGSFENAALANDGNRQYFDNTFTLVTESPSWLLSSWTKYNGDPSGNGYFQNYSAAQLATEYPSNPLPDGEQVLGLGRGGAASVIQNLGQVTTGESYTLSGYLGRPATEGVNPTGGYIMQLYLGDTPNALTTPIMTLNNASVTDPALGEWKFWSGTSSVITSEQNGKYLTAYIYANTGTYPSIREFDNLQLAIKTTPATSITSSLNPSGQGDSVTFTATVSGTPTPTGTVQFIDNGTNIGTPVALNGSGVATLTTSSLTLGNHQVTALYSGDSNYNANYDWVLQVVANNQPVAAVQNGSFETTAPVNPLPEQTQAFFDDTQYILTEWTEYNGENTTSGYVFNRSAAAWSTAYGSSTRYGNNVLGLGRAGASSVHQQLGVVATGQSYTVTGLVGRPNGNTTVPDQYDVVLYIGATPGALTTIIGSATITEPAEGTWEPFTLTSSAITAEQSGQYLTLRLYVNGALPADTTTAREFDNIAITVNSGSPYASWSQTNFGNPSADPNDDPDFDGASNQLEYAMGTNPNQANPSSTPVAYAVASGNSNLSITFTLSETATDLSYIVQTSTNLSTWTDEVTYVPTGTGYTRTGSGTTQTADVDNGSTRTITEQASAAVGVNPRRFIRVKLVK